jgi:hypothetical protein
MDRVEVRSGVVHTAEHKGGTDVALVPEQHLLQQLAGRHHGHNFPVGAQAVQLQLRRNHLRRHFSVCGSSSTATTRKLINFLSVFLSLNMGNIVYLLHVLGKVMNLGAVLVGHNRVFSGTGVSAQNHTILVDDSYDGGASFSCLGQRVSLVHQRCIPVTKFKQVSVI